MNEIEQFINIAEALQRISAASGPTAKSQLLAYYADLPGFKKVLHFIYNPYSKCNIGEAKMRKAYRVSAQEMPVGVLIDYLLAHPTGSDADVCTALSFTKQFEHLPNVENIAKQVVMQNLKIGASVTTLNAVYGTGFIPVVGCMLGKLYEKVPNPSWPCIMTEKLDGIRRIVIKEKGCRARAFSRSGHEDTGIAEILDEVDKYLPVNFVYDGELLALGKFADNIETRQATASIANSKGTKTGVALNCFDMIPLDEFYAGRSSQRALDRKIRLGATMKDPSIGFLTDSTNELMAVFGADADMTYVRSVPILGVATTMEEVEPVLNYIWQNNGEGIMLNSIRGYYEVKRSNDLMKLKFVTEKEAKVVDVIEGSGKYTGTTGALIIEYNGARVGVGSGLADYERDKIWSNKSAYIGRTIEVDTFGESKNAHGGISLNCPIFKRFKGDEE